MKHRDSRWKSLRGRVKKRDNGQVWPFRACSDNLECGHSKRGSDCERRHVKGLGCDAQWMVVLYRNETRQRQISAQVLGIGIPLAYYYCLHYVSVSSFVRSFRKESPFKWIAVWGAEYLPVYSVCLAQICLRLRQMEWNMEHSLCSSWALFTYLYIYLLLHRWSSLLWLLLLRLNAL